MNTKTNSQEAFSKHLQELGIDLIFLVGFMRLVPSIVEGTLSSHLEYTLSCFYPVCLGSFMRLSGK